MKDSELIQKVHSGNKEAVGIIIERYYADIYRFSCIDKDVFRGNHMAYSRFYADFSCHDGNCK